MGAILPLWFALGAVANKNNEEVDWATFAAFPCNFGDGPFESKAERAQRIHAEASVQLLSGKAPKRGQPCRAGRAAAAATTADSTENPEGTAPPHVLRNPPRTSQQHALPRKQSQSLPRSGHRRQVSRKGLQPEIRAAPRTAVLSPPAAVLLVHFVQHDGVQSSPSMTTSSSMSGHQSSTLTARHRQVGAVMLLCRLSKRVSRDKTVETKTRMIMKNMMVSTKRMKSPRSQPARTGMLFKRKRMTKKGAVIRRCIKETLTDRHCTTTFRWISACRRTNTGTMTASREDFARKRRRPPLLDPMDLRNLACTNMATQSSGFAALPLLRNPKKIW